MVAVFTNERMVLTVYFLMLFGGMKLSFGQIGGFVRVHPDQSLWARVAVVWTMIFMRPRPRTKPMTAAPLAQQPPDTSSPEEPTSKTPPQQKL
jgi:hypothetical protein